MYGGAQVVGIKHIDSGIVFVCHDTGARTTASYQRHLAKYLFKPTPKDTTFACVSHDLFRVSRALSTCVTQRIQCPPGNARACSQCLRTNSLHVLVLVCTCVYMLLFVCVCMSWCMYAFMRVCVCARVSLSLSLSLSLSVGEFFFLLPTSSLCLSPTVCLSIWLLACLLPPHSFCSPSLSLCHGLDIHMYMYIYIYMYM